MCSADSFMPLAYMNECETNVHLQTCLSSMLPGQAAAI